MAWEQRVSRDRRHRPGPTMWQNSKTTYEITALRDTYRLNADNGVAIGRLFRERSVWLGFQSIEYGNRGDRGRKASEACRPSQKRAESDHGIVSLTEN